MRSLETSPASLLSVAVALIIIAVLLLRNVRKVFNWKRTKEIFPDQPAIATKPKGTERSLDCTDATARNCDLGPSRSFNDALVTFSGLELETSFEAECIENVGDLPRLDQRHHIAMEMHRNHRDSNLAPTDERVRASIIAYKEKKNTHLRSCWKGLCSMRIPKSDWSTGEGMICLCYLVINIAALMVSPTYGFDVAFGSLSVGNTLFLVALATRNSIFTWVLGMAFDQMLVYHRFLGRITILTAVIHALFYVKRITDFSDPVILTGVLSLGCGLLIAVTSLNCIRRRFFNIFFYSHFAFIGFLVGIFMHAPGAQPFIVLSIVSYIIDKVLQMIWTQLPRKTTKFEKAGDRTAHVQFAKTPLSKLLGRHKVGQYVFVNFPELALNEWHVSNDYKNTLFLLVPVWIACISCQVTHHCLIMLSLI